MHLESLLHFFIWLPLAAFLLSILLPSRAENLISGTSFVTMGLHFILSQLFIVYWLFMGAEPITNKEFVLFKGPEYEFFLDFYFDRITATYLAVGSLLTFLVTIYSRYYLHREEGYKRFFNTIHFFYLGYNMAIFSGNLETLFVGWEILGISSFLLIAFYRDRYLPVKNAVKVFSIYRIGDVGIILAMWMSHHLWHLNITFNQLNKFELVHHQLQNHTLVGIFISLMFLVSAAAKSAQLPFSAWVPRAMEGPTPSSAIFYGSLSVHLGVFLMMRTFTFWEHQTSVRIVIGLLGLVTAVVATLTARVQSSVKTQIAYASVSQIGIIFIELALGLQTLALIHFAGNAFLRTYQLLVSPSVVTYLIKEQFYHFKPREHSVEDSLPKKLEYSLYILSLKEWNLDRIMYNYLWEPFKIGGRLFKLISLRTMILALLPVFAIGVFILLDHIPIPQQLHDFVPSLLAVIGTLLVCKGFVERRNPVLSWTTVVMSHFWIALAISFNEEFAISESLFYLSGVLVSGVVGWICLDRLAKIANQPIDMERFYGYGNSHRWLSFIFLLACLGVAGFPITPSFIGEDLIFTHIHYYQLFLAFFVSVNMILNGLAIVRLYARLFLGPVAPDYVKSS
jgi:NADH-quinone oxidoreductase subunit L